VAISARQLVLALPPLSLIPVSLSHVVTPERCIALHFIILGVSYSLVLLAGQFEHVVHISAGIGIVQNPPFLAHIICGAASVGLPIAIAKRIAATQRTRPDEVIVAEFLDKLDRSRTKTALYSLAFIIGLAALVNTVVLSITSKVDIYDSVQHPLTFVSYFFLRTYLFLLAYPFMIVGTVASVFYLFRILRNSVAIYQPFHEDETGGFRKYFYAVDRPVYLVQTLTVLVSVMNYWGWGGMALVPVIFSIAAPAIVSGFAFLLLFDFHKLLTLKKKEEIFAIRRQQMDLYPEAKRLSSISPTKSFDILKRIEAMNVLIDTIRKGREGGWGKYVVNVLAVIIGQLVKPLAAGIVSRLHDLL